MAKWVTVVFENGQSFEFYYWHQQWMPAGMSQAVAFVESILPPHKARCVRWEDV